MQLNRSIPNLRAADTIKSRLNLVHGNISKVSFHMRLKRFINVLQIGYSLTLPNLQKVWMKGSIFWVCTKADNFQFRPVVDNSIGSTILGAGGGNANERAPFDQLLPLIIR